MNRPNPNLMSGRHSLEFSGPRGADMERRDAVVYWHGLHGFVRETRVRNAFTGWLAIEPVDRAATLARMRHADMPVAADETSAAKHRFSAWCAFRRVDGVRFFVTRR